MSPTSPRSAAHPPRWHQRARQALACSLRLRLVLAFLALAMAMSFVFISGAKRAFTLGWEEAARPLLSDYVDRLAGDIAPGQLGPPDVARALAITQRLPVTIDIRGPQVNWRSHPEQPPLRSPTGWRRSGDNPNPEAPGAGSGSGSDYSSGFASRNSSGDSATITSTSHSNATTSPAGTDSWDKDPGWRRLLQRQTADGHHIDFSINTQAFERRPRMVGYAIVALLLLTLLAYLYVRRLLQPLDPIRAGAQRFGAGQFDTPIPVRHPERPDELGQLAATINTMGRDIHQMLEAKRSLLLAISHELRSPLTRARLHTELLPERADTAPQREALQRELQEMATLISDLLESERLASPHAALHREPVDLAALARDVIHDLAARHPDRAQAIVLHAEPQLPRLPLDPARMRLLLRNLLDNALRHGTPAGTPPPELQLGATPEGGLRLGVRDFGPGVPEAHLPHLADPFYRPDSARTRSAGGVGLGLNLCRLVVLAHGGRFEVMNAGPGLRVVVDLPAS